jgi:serine/threonine protein kinase
VTEFAENGALADHLPMAKAILQCEQNRIARIIVGIVLAMRYLHRRGVVHRDLRPENIFLDWDWNVRIDDFGRSQSEASREIPMFDGSSYSRLWLSLDCRYLAPERWENGCDPKSDVYSFGLILYEILVGEPVIPTGLRQPVVLKMVLSREFRPAIPDWIAPKVKDLIGACWAQKPRDRPSFEDIIENLKEMDFKLFGGVNSSKLRDFVERVERTEQENERGNANGEAKDGIGREH